MSTQKGMGLLLGMPGRDLSISYGSTALATSVLTTYTNEDGEPIDLVTGLINLLADAGDELGTINMVSELTGISIPDLQLDPDFAEISQSWTTIYLYELQIRYDRFRSDKSKQYGIKGEVGWKPRIDLGLADPIILDVEASLSLKKIPGEKVTGEICGMVQTDIEGLEFLSLGACLRMQKKVSNGAEVRDPISGKVLVENKLFFLIRIGEVTFEAHYRKTAGNLHLEFGVKFTGELRLGDVVTFFASLVDPSIEEYEFDPPWDFMAKFNLGSLLRDLRLTLDIDKASNTKTFGFSLPAPSGLIPNELKPFLNITRVGLTFLSSPSKKTTINISGSFLGKSFSDVNPLSWDPVDGKPPAIPGKGGSVFDLRYLGMGQHVAFTQAANVNSIKDVMDTLRGTLDSNQAKLVANRRLSLESPQKSFLSSDSPIAFSAESEWLIGMDVSLLKMLNLSLIFNDPVIYGLRIELYGKAAKNFKGFVFEILYTKISDTIGKYHGELVLPDKFRRMEFGATTVILPGIIVDIYTNGDFGVDLGFPRNFDYTRSFAMELFPFIGAGGFYFRKLSAATASSTPVLAPQDNGVFTPVYEFGIGLRLGLGKSFNKGPLKAEISITLVGIIEGVISWYRPADGSEETTYYKLSGGVGIVGRLYGVVDLVVLSIDIEVIAEATILFLMEAYKDIEIRLSARVSVSGSIKIGFVRVRKSYSTTVEQHFTIDSPTGYTTPWIAG